MYLEFKKERDDDFAETYKTVIAGLGKQARFTPRQQLIRLTVNHPAKRYYVSYEQASRILSRLLHRKKVTFKNPLKKEMYMEILKQIRTKKKTTDKPLSQILAETIYSPAPRFYLTVETATLLYNSLLKNKQL